ncbi:fibronectin type III domain-containing protein 1-like [Acanthaster planci]|uniref:Fibronectin type III domain-containing protein 1-like n=1 Tax=Acanthaster planci TaxID=133434 RepID=A0A8B7Y3I1_ACAPL|nr:fibronectin type III domain-containing protein 1-like [Acanthaster planci]
MLECAEGKYGADCKQTCHCASGETCSKDTGECSNGVCDSSFYGINCQCSRQEVTPVEVTATSVMQHNLSFSWSRPPCGFQGGTVTAYSYKLVELKSGTTLKQSSITLHSVTLEGLIPYTNYSFQVAVATDTGSLPLSDSIIVETLEAEPTAPRAFAVRGADEDSITVEWAEPEPPHGVITNYDIAYWRTSEIQPGWRRQT